MMSFLSEFQEIQRLTDHMMADVESMHDTLVTIKRMKPGAKQ